MSRSLRSDLHHALIAALRTARKAAGLSQTDLAKRLYRPQSYVAKIEIGERRLDVIEFVEYAEALGAGPTDLLAKILQTTA